MKKTFTPDRINLTYDMGYWARQFKVSTDKIGEAIRNTGSNRVGKIKTYIRQREAS